MEGSRRIPRSPTARRIQNVAFLLSLLFVFGLVYGKECTNVPTERVSHTIRSLSIAERGGVFNEESVVDEIGVIPRILAMPMTALSHVFRKFWSWNVGDEVRDFVVEEEIPDDVLVDFDDWGQARRTIAISFAGESGRRAELYSRSSDQSDGLGLQLQVEEEVGGNNEDSSEEIVSRSEPAVAGLLKDVSLHKVRLGGDSPQFVAQNTNLNYLLELDIDRMVWSFRKVAGLDAPGQPYGGWESPASELRGHFVGHYLSASALLWASTHNESLKNKMNALVQALKECQTSIDSGYLSAFPSEFFDRFEAIEPVWAPYYTIHKIMAGLLDQYVLAESGDALDMVVEMANYFYRRVKRVINKFTIERHWRSLNEETGGMNDVLYRLFIVTEDKKHLELAHLFDKPCFLGPLALQVDHLSGFHSNTHIPVVVGAQMRYEVTGDPIYRSIGEYFMKIVNSSHSYATGGTSVSEFWVDPMRQGDTLRTENQESCTTYNMLKIARTLFRWTKDVKYMDYYERALVNGVLGIQRGRQPGVMIYMLPLGPGTSKAISYHGWGNKFDSFWCCYGSAIESFAKLGDSIYFEGDTKTPSIYVTQFTSSEFEWDDVGLVLRQSHKPSNAEQSLLEVNLSFSPLSIDGVSAATSEKNATVHVRIPAWTPRKRCRAYLNGEEIEAPVPGKFLSIEREWSPGDQLVLSLPLGLRLEKIQDDRSAYSAMHAILYGPFVMAGRSMGDWELGHVSNLSERIHPVPAAYSKQLSTFSQELSDGDRSSSPLLYMACENGTAFMSSAPVDGTDESGFTTFRVSDPLGTYLQRAANGERAVSLELFSLPGRFLRHNGKDNLISAGPSSCLQYSGANYRKRSHKQSMHLESLKALGDCPTEDSVFLFLPGLTGASETVSFEAVSQPGCFLSSSYGDTAAPVGVVLRCKTSEIESSFAAQSTFSVQRGVAEYHPLSFIAEGENRTFLLAPLNSLRDESYTVYFDIQLTEKSAFKAFS